MRGVLALAVLVAPLPALAACRGEPERITVAVSSSARHALPALLDAFEGESPGEVSLLVAGSGTLADWIEEGAQVDVVLLGDEANLERLAVGRHLDETTRAAVASHRLVLVAVAPGPRVTFATLDQLPPTQPIAVGNPDFSSAGVHARALFQRLGRWDDLRPRLLLRGDVAAALASARRGQAAAAVVYDTDAHGVDDVVVLDTANEPPHAQLWLALTPTGKRRARARDLAGFLRSGAAQEIFAEHAFLPPE